MRDFLLASSSAVLVHPVQLWLIAAVNVCAFTPGLHKCSYFANAFSIACAIIEILPPGQAGGLGSQYSGTAGRIPEISRYAVLYITTYPESALTLAKSLTVLVRSLHFFFMLLPTF